MSKLLLAKWLGALGLAAMITTVGHKEGWWCDAFSWDPFGGCHSGHSQSCYPR